MILEVYTDASIKTYPNGRTFGCSGAICPTTGESIYSINPDTTNNKSELRAIYIGVQLIKDIIDRNPMYNEIYLYSDSQFSIFGLTKWMYGWSRTLKDNVIYGSNKEPVKNQQMFYEILTFLCIHNIKINFRHQSGHVNFNDAMSLMNANEVFRKSNGYYLNERDIYKISFYNDLVDKSTRSKLEGLDPNLYPILNGEQVLCNILFPMNFKKYV